MPRNKPARRRSGPVDLVDAMNDLTLIMPRLRDTGDDTGDPEEAMENGAKREEGLYRHGFKSLISETG